MGVKMEIKPSDIKWLRKHYTGLRVRNDNAVVGILRYRARKIGPLRVNIFHGPPSDEERNERFYIEDKYAIDLSFDGGGLPHVKETGGRLKRRAQEIADGDLPTVHVFPKSEELCLGSNLSVRLRMRKIDTLEDFFDELLIPYFYYHSYWEKHGQEPWPGRSHGCDVAVHLEDMYRHRKFLDSEIANEAIRFLLEQGAPPHIFDNEKMGPNAKCFCGSRRKVKDCHPEAREGFNILRKWARLKQH